MSTYTNTEIEYVQQHLDCSTIGQICTALGKSRKSLFSYLRARKIRMEDHPALYDVPPMVFEQPNTPEAAYLLGYLWADGHLDTSTNTLILDCVSEDIDAIEGAFDATGGWLKRRLARKGKRPTRVISTVNGRLSAFLQRHGFAAKSERSPDSLLDLIPRHLQPLFWRGYFDGDGCLSGSTALSVAGSYDQDWTAWERLLGELNVRYRVVRRHQTATSSSSCVVISGQANMRTLLAHLYQSYPEDRLGLPRKHASYVALLDHIERRPRSKTGFIGVHRNRRRFYAKMCRGGGKRKVQTYIGFYDTAEEAARAYDRKMVELHGERARTNYPVSEYLNPTP